MNVSLTDPMKRWVQERIDSGDYASASDYIRDLIRHDQQRRDAQAALVDALIEGEQSGLSERGIDEILGEARRRAGARGNG
jgi:antitoxin ParD1/3/4